MVTESKSQVRSDSSRYVLRALPQTRRAEWDAFVENHPNGHFLQSWGWGELKATAGWSPLRLALCSEEQIVAVAQVLRKTAPRVPLALGHLAYIPRGPVVDWQQPELVRTFFAQLDRYVRRQGALALRWEPDVEVATTAGEAVERFTREWGATEIAPVQPGRSIVLDLAPDEDRLLAQMKEKWRYNVRLGARKGVQVRLASSLADVEGWYTLLRTTGDRDQFGIHSLAYYQRVWELYAPSDNLRLLLAEHDGQLLAGIMIAIMGRQAIYLYGASSNQQRQLMPNYVLQWEAIRWAKQCGAHVYDFWGIPASDDEDEAMAGVYRFKRGWGGRVVQYAGGYEHIYRPLSMRLARRFL
ncbi:lipid II:glycine glycyltransferase FemX [Dictyobacter aurantiacus]|uniref:Methicillin resistance protein n=1 Tax=Dictyobacter aurantiacus TaxID=1936993 RepID=A0A401ZBC6_9CHLR|nr:peptidoglycan bridge formation glycyltransferase FemA/FemB family protein [Dictyobacter aurantiacus]GCE04053.1 methicillin resistance protein [Dictyobacter aurantiacus]